VAGEDQALWEALRECRRALAAEQGVPPYVIFHDATLREMCAARPLDLDAFGQISGVGARKRDKYAEAFMRVIRDHS
jgi:ATP-dependent DNA helicase RecQ